MWFRSTQCFAYVTQYTFFSDESDDEDDDEAELQAELQRIKDEREQAAQRKAQEESELELRLNRESAMKNNPLALLEENSAKVCMCSCFALSDEHAPVYQNTDYFLIETLFDLLLCTLFTIWQIKRRWNDDVVFRNQTRDEPEQKKRFINDTIRSDFHRSFIKKFMK